MSRENIKIVAYLQPVFQLKVYPVLEDKRTGKRPGRCRAPQQGMSPKVTGGVPKSSITSFVHQSRLRIPSAKIEFSEE